MFNRHYLKAQIQLKFPTKIYYIFLFELKK
jgi:hypothetical protein